MVAVVPVCRGGTGCTSMCVGGVVVCGCVCMLGVCVCVCVLGLGRGRMVWFVR